MINKYQISKIKNQGNITRIGLNPTRSIPNRAVSLCFAFCILTFEFAYGIWGISQDIRTRGAGNVGYTGYLTLPLYLTGEVRDSAIRTGSDDKYKTYGGCIQYGIANNFDVGLHGNSSINSSIGVNLKYQAVDKLTTIVGFDYVMNEMMLAPFGVLMAGADLNRNFSVYGGIKAFQWPDLIIREFPIRGKENTFGTILFTGIHIFRKEGWKDQRMSSMMPTGLYIELGYPVNIDSKTITITLGLDGFLGLSFPRMQWR